MAYILKPDGTREVVRPAGQNGTEWTLEQIQAAVEGYIELVPGIGLQAFCNEDGQRKELPLNPQASRQFGQVLLGNVLVIEKTDPPVT